MKKIILTALTVVALHTVQAQQNQPPATATTSQRQAPSPEQMATRQSARLQKELQLTDDQKQKVYQAAVTRNTAMQQIKAKYATEKKGMGAEAKPVREKYISDVNAALTPEQQQKWEQMRKDQKEKSQNNGGGKAGPQEGGND